MLTDFVVLKEKKVDKKVFEYLLQSVSTEVYARIKVSDEGNVEFDSFCVDDSILEEKWLKLSKRKKDILELVLNEIDLDSLLYEEKKYFNED